MDVLLPSFDELVKLAEQSPEKLDELRKKAIDELIQSAPEKYRNRLRGLQFQIDCHRKIHKTPYGACVAISQMMHESLIRLNDALNGDTYCSSGSQKSEPESCSVIPFPAVS